jgi:hypothetical protein
MEVPPSLRISQDLPTVVGGEPNAAHAKLVSIAAPISVIIAEHCARHGGLFHETEEVALRRLSPRTGSLQQKQA